MKILTVCEGGNVRSVTLGCLLKYYFRGNHEVIAASASKLKSPTLQMLVDWADTVLVVDLDIEEMLGRKIDHGHGKIKLAHLGPDIWGMSMHPDLTPRAHAVLVELGYDPRKDEAEIVARTKRYEDKRAV
jgi:hypothetical protein